MWDNSDYAKTPGINNNTKLPYQCLQSKYLSNVNRQQNSTILAVNTHSHTNHIKMNIISHQNGFKMARQFGRVQATGSYIIGGRSGRSFRGVYKQLRGTTMRVASSRLDGHTFQLNLTPSLSSFCCINSWYVAILHLTANKSTIHA